MQFGKPIGSFYVPSAPGYVDLTAVNAYNPDKARALLKEAGIALAIVSSNTEANVRHVLGPCASRFRHYACGASMFGKAKRLTAAPGLWPMRKLVRDGG